MIVTDPQAAPVTIMHAMFGQDHLMRDGDLNVRLQQAGLMPGPNRDAVLLVELDADGNGYANVSVDDTDARTVEHLRQAADVLTRAADALARVEGGDAVGGHR